MAILICKNTRRRLIKTSELICSQSPWAYLQGGKWGGPHHKQLYESAPPPPLKIFEFIHFYLFSFLTVVFQEPFLSPSPPRSPLHSRSPPSPLHFIPPHSIPLLYSSHPSPLYPIPPLLESHPLHPFFLMTWKRLNTETLRLGWARGPSAAARTG